MWCRRANSETDFRRLLPARCLKGAGGGGQRFPVHTFGFGSDHDAGAMHTIAEETGGVFSFVEAEDTVQVCVVDPPPLPGIDVAKI